MSTGTDGEGVASITIRGLVAGLAGTFLLGAFERMERYALGREPVYAPGRIVTRLSGRMGIALTPTQTRQWGGAMRWLYGPVLGVASRLIRPSPSSRAGRVIRTSATIFGFELVVLPLLGAVPPLGDWPIVEIVSLAAHTTAFALGAEAPAVARAAATVIL
ncbi:MAG TPA: hypothetical protein VGP07_23275 [Polyangia bacterium]|jgi:hypothetical protein